MRWCRSAAPPALGAPCRCTWFRVRVRVRVRVTVRVRARDEIGVS